MKILSDEDGDTIMDDHFEEDEPMNTNIDNIGSGGVCGKHGSWASKDPAGQCPGCYSSSDLDKRLQETIIGFAQRYSQAQDFVKLGDKQAVNNLLTEAIAAIHSALDDAGYIHKSTISYPEDVKKALNYYSGADWLERFTEELADWPITYANDGEKHLIERMLEYVNEAAKRASGIEEDNHGE